MGLRGFGAKSEGTIAREELLDDKGEFRAEVGDPVTAYVVSTSEGEILLSRKMTAAASDDANKGALIEAEYRWRSVTRSVRAVTASTVLGQARRFCPYSQWI